MADKKNYKDSFFRLFLRFKQQANKGLALFAVLIIPIAGFTGNDKLMYGTILFLISIMVLEIFNIRQLTEKGPTTLRVFNNINKAHSQIKVCINKSIKGSKELVIQEIGMTMFNAWAEMVLIYSWIAQEHPDKKVKIEIAMSQSKWLDEHNINLGWTGDAADTIENRIFADLTGLSSAVEGGLDWSVEIARYAHMPTIHGILINETYAFMGIARWDGIDLKGGDRTFELYDSNEDDYSKEKVNVFKRWFDYCFNRLAPWVDESQNIKKRELRSSNSSGNS